MKQALSLFLCCMLLLIGCKKTDETPTHQSSEKNTEDKTGIKKECYEYNKDGNSISVLLEISGKNVTGGMSYALAEKDKNAGILTGHLENNILIADYHFQSEGVQSTRQVAFQLKGDQLIEGYGEMNKDGTRFKDTAAIQFNSLMPLHKMNCPK